MRKILLYFIVFSFLLYIVFAQDSFNLEVEIPETYEEVLAGENIWFTTKLLNLGNKDRMDVTLKYEILDINKQLKSSKSETVAVETQASFVGSLKVPESLEKGLYFLRVILVTVDSEQDVSEAETSFNVIKEETKHQIVIKFSLFDIQITIPDDYKIINPGDELLASIKLVNLGSAGRVDVFLDYWITDPGKNTILRKKETVAVETQANFVKTFDIPKDVSVGKYTLYAKITYADGKEAGADHSFEVVKKQIDKRIYYGFAILFSLIILVYVIYKSKPLVKKMQIDAKVWRIVKKKQIKK